MKVIQVVTAIAAVQIGRRPKLPVVRILMAIRTSGERHLELRMLVFLNVARSTFHRCMFSR